VKAEPIRYMVVCDHPDIDRRYFVADIDDERPLGGAVRIRIDRGVISTLVTPANKRGSRRRIPFRCGACGSRVSRFVRLCDFGSVCGATGFVNRKLLRHKGFGNFMAGRGANSSSSTIRG